MIDNEVVQKNMKKMKWNVIYMFCCVEMIKETQRDVLIITVQ